ncbi:MAG: type II toxin-antitoxin system prevent-host-death family antitoxin [Acidobacteriota bacterium]|nr:type II toxin-antitoxin system prevent-host-death family antitoxin [Acidobacteriota bacterium]
MAEVGVKALKDHLSEYLRRAHSGERIVITERGRPLAVLLPIEETAEARYAWDLVQNGAASWEGGKPVGSARPVAGRDKTASDIVLEDRR